MSTPAPGDESRDVLQEAIDATSTAYAADSAVDVDAHLRAELRSRGHDQLDESWVDATVRDIRAGHSPTVGRHDGSVDVNEEESP